MNPPLQPQAAQVEQQPRAVWAEEVAVEQQHLAFLSAAVLFEEA
jgi:hypothetical protein